MDHGISWELLFDGYQFMTLDISSSDVIAVGCNPWGETGVIFGSNDGGINWIDLTNNLPPNSISRVKFNPDNYLYSILSNEQHLFKTTTIVGVIEDSNPKECDILIYPNPAGSSFHIQTPATMQPESVIIFSCDGRQVTEIHSTGNTIDVSDLNRGIYLIELIFQHLTVKRRLIIL